MNFLVNLALALIVVILYSAHNQPSMFVCSEGLVLFIVAFYTICHIYDYCTSVVVFRQR
jgi:hypothetical protein